MSLTDDLIIIIIIDVAEVLLINALGMPYNAFMGFTQLLYLPYILLLTSSSLGASIVVIVGMACLLSRSSTLVWLFYGRGLQHLYGLFMVEVFDTLVIFF